MYVVDISNMSISIMSHEKIKSRSINRDKSKGKNIPHRSKVCYFPPSRQYILFYFTKSHLILAKTPASLAPTSRRHPLHPPTKYLHQRQHSHPPT